MQHLGFIIGFYIMISWSIGVGLYLVQDRNKYFIKRLTRFGLVLAILLGSTGIIFCGILELLFRLSFKKVEND